MLLLLERCMRKNKYPENFYKYFSVKQFHSSDSIDFKSMHRRPKIKRLE